MRCLIFDWDGVIADSIGMFFDLYRDVCSHFGKRLPVSTIDEFRHWYKPRWERNYLDMGFTDEDLREILHYAGRRVAERYGQVPLFALAVKALRSLAVEVPLAIASTTHASIIRRRLDSEGLGSLFRVVVGGEGGGSDKMQRYLQAVEALGFEPQHAVGVGDTAHDVECARHWGMATVGVTYGWSAPSIVEASQPDRLVHEPGELEAALREMLSRNGR